MSSEKTTILPPDENPDEWHLFLSRYLDNRATEPNGLTYVAERIADAIRRAKGLRDEEDTPLLGPDNDDL